MLKHNPKLLCKDCRKLLKGTESDEVVELLLCGKCKDKFQELLIKELGGK